jgi:hypothetical protein
MKREPTYYHYLAFFILYFFFNNLFLEQGLLYTTLLAPVFLYWLFKKKRLTEMLKWAVLLLIPIPFHLLAGVDYRSYFISTVIVASAWIFLFTALETVRATRDQHEDFFQKALVVNSVLLLIALIILPFPVVRDFMWDTTPMSRNLSAIPRLQMLAYEPSHYGLLLTPVFLFFFLKIIPGKTGHPLLLASGIGLPLLLTFSFGIMGALFLAILIASTAFFSKFNVDTKRLILYSLLFLLAVSAGFWLFWPDNPLFIRMENIVAGADSSSKGRLVYSFMFAKDLVMEHNAWLGVGPGQIKMLAHDLIINFYKYTGEYAEIVRIPNSMGEMLATYGFYGVILKIAIEVIFFFRLKIYRNLYSLSLFIFIFIYQFTGSFVVNAAEIGAWALVFSSRIPAFEFDRINPR